MLLTLEKSMDVKKEFEYIDNHFENVDKETLIEELKECGLKTTNENYYIDCIGVDRKRHVCEPDKNVAICGVKILKKKVTDRDRELFPYSCYECTY
jgi:2C-methyl-D-erythritol 2,4-cyclodiphosphate synthase